MSSYRKFTFGISSPDEFLVFITPLGQHIMNTHIRKETHIRNVHNKSLTQSQYLAAVTGMLVLKGMLVLSRYVELLIAARDSPLTAALSTPALSTLTSSCYVVACPLPRCPPPPPFLRAAFSTSGLFSAFSAFRYLTRSSNNLHLTRVNTSYGS